MKLNSLYSSLLLVGLTMISCKKEEEAVTTVDSNKQIIMPRVAPIPTGNTTVQQPQQPAQTITPEQMQMQMQMQQQNTSTNNQVAATKPGMNPPHGQPGHQCGIPVGAPLNSNANSAPATPKAGSASTTQQMTITPPTQTTSSAPAILNPNTAGTVTEPGMNPPHGEPGHQCGIPVGSPLPK